MTRKTACTLAALFFGGLAVGIYVAAIWQHDVHTGNRLAGTATLALILCCAAGIGAS